jgi:hypothetical protein
MKTLFFLVVIANVALFMWEFKTGAFVPVTETSEQNADGDQEPILLVSELKNVPQAISPGPVSEPPAEGNTVKDETGKLAQVPETLPATPASIEKPALEKLPALASSTSNADKIAKRCYEAGPFVNQKDFRNLVKQLKDIEIEIKPIHRDGRIPSNYMVYYPAAETEPESKANVKMLKDHGIKDLWLLTGEDKGKISLGLFIKEESALTMKNQLLAKGINAEIAAKYKSKPQQYALIKGDDKLMERLDNLKKSYPELAVKQVPDLTPGCAGK